MARYADLLVDLLLVRRLIPYHANTRKRLVRSPKVLYPRQRPAAHLIRHPRPGDFIRTPGCRSELGGVRDQDLARLWSGPEPPGFYRTSTGAEIDLVLPMSREERWAIEIKRGLSPGIDKGFHQAQAGIRPADSFVVYLGTDRFPLAAGIEVIGLREMAEIVVEHSQRP